MRSSTYPSALYNVSVEGKGFRRSDVTGVKVEVNQQAKVDVSLQVGEVTQSVEVAANASLVQTESTDVGTVIDNKRFVDLPLTLGGGIRNPSAFIYLSPGVSPGSTWEKHIGGGGSFNDQIYFDGIALSRGDLANDAEVNPSVDAIGEFKLVTNNYSAEYTHALSGVTSFTMKSGTNQLHGSGFEFHDNQHFDARGFFPGGKSAPHSERMGIHTRRSRGFSQGVQRRNKTFWFFSLDQFYIRGGQLSGLNTNATAKMLGGDFSELSVPIADPRSTVINANGSATRMVFPGQHHPEVSLLERDLENAAILSAGRIAGTHGQQHCSARESSGRSAHLWFQDRSVAFAAITA